MKQGRRRRAVAAAGSAVVVVMAVIAGWPGFAAAGEPAGPVVRLTDRPAYLDSPYHGVTDGNGRVIPCRCRYRQTSVRVGEVVCMTTHLGTVMARCDLIDNNTSWIPTDVPCVISRSRDGGNEIATAIPR